MAIPSLAMIPSGYKDGKVYSVLPANGDGDFDFSRGSNATRVNKDGLIETVTGDTPRLDYTDSSCPSLLLEPQRTNLVLESNNFDNYYSKIFGSTISSNVEISPDGTQNADKVIRGTDDLVLRRSSQVSTGTEYAFSVYAKKGSFSTMALDIGDEGIVSFTLTDEWQKFTVVANPSTFTHIDIALPNSSQGDFIYLYGAQVEEGSYATSYIPTSGSAVTRLADECNNGGNEQVFDNNTSVLFIDLERIGIGSSTIGDSVTLKDNSNVSQITLWFDSPSEQVRFRDSKNSFATIGGIISTLYGERKKIALKIDGTTLKVFADGVQSGGNYTRPTAFDFTKIEMLGKGYKIRDLRYYNTALTDQELQALTQV